VTARMLARIVFWLVLTGTGVWTPASFAGAPPHDCIPPSDGTYGAGSVGGTYDYATAYSGGYKGQACGDATRGMMLYRSDVGPLGRAWRCDACHQPNPLDDANKDGSGAPILMRGAPRNPQYIAEKLPYAPGAGITWTLMTQLTCGTGDPSVHCLEDSKPSNVMGDIGDIAEFLYTCNIGIAPCVTGGGGGGGGGPTPGQLQGSGTMAFGSQAVGTASSPLALTLTNIGSASVNVSAVTSDSTEFVVSSNNCTTLSQSAYCTVNVTFKPAATGPRSGVVTVTSDGLFSPQKFTFTGAGSGSGTNHTGIWWNASESGWGVNFQHDGNTIFATWFIYDAAGNPWWIVMTASDPSGTGTFTGELWKTTGSGYDADAFTKGVAVSSGTGTIAFSDATHATLTYNVTGMGVVTKAITPQPFGTQPVCTYSTAANLAGATNYQGLWWNAGEDGWGINLAHHDNTIFATWFTFSSDRSPLWLVASMNKGTDGIFRGKLLRMTATPFGVVPFAANPYVEAGDASLAFTDGNSASFHYAIGAVSKTKSITRQPLGAPTAGTVCH
jgi:hypothetical protein